MSLVLAANDVAADLTGKIRSRIAEGAQLWEMAVEDLPFWFAAACGAGAAAIQTAFRSEYALLAVLEGGRTVVRRVRH